MKSCMPEAYKGLAENCEILERHYKDMIVKVHVCWKMILIVIKYIHYLLDFGGDSGLHFLKVLGTWSIKFCLNLTIY